MALRRCAHCGKDIDASAEACPNCGSIPLECGGCMVYVLALLLLAVFLTLITCGSIIGLSYYQKKNPSPEAISTKPANSIPDSFRTD